MSDSIGRIVGIFIAVCLMFFLPLIYFGERQDTLEQMYLITETTDFVDTVRMTGVLDKEVYQVFCRKIAKMSGDYKVKMSHQSRRLEIVDERLQLVRGEFYQEQILEVLEKKEKYAFQEGDFFRVELIRAAPGFMEGLWSRLLGRKEREAYVSVYYGGKICYDGN